MLCFVAIHFRQHDEEDRVHSDMRFSSDITDDGPTAEVCGEAQQDLGAIDHACPAARETFRFERITTCTAAALLNDCIL